MSLSLIAVFIPILLMGGVVGRLFREFAITLSAAILVSLVVSLTTTPMMCSRLTQEHGRTGAHGRLHGLSERAFDAAQDGYRRSLEWALAHGPTVMLILAVTVVLNVYLYIHVPKGFFPQQDTGLMMGQIQADQSISFQAMRRSCATSSTSCCTIRRSPRWWDSPAAAGATAATCSSRSSRAPSAASARIK